MYLGQNLCSVLNKLTLSKSKKSMSTKRKPHRKFTELERKSYIREYLSSSDRRKTFERRNGLSLGTLSRWMKMYEIEDPKMQKSIIDPQLIDEDSAALIAQLPAENEALHKSNRQLQRDLDTTKMLHKACEVLIDLTEQTYHIPVRKNSDAK